MILVCVTRCSYASTRTEATTLAVAMQNLPLFMQPQTYPALFVILNEKGEVVEALGDVSLLLQILKPPSTNKLTANQIAHWLDCKHEFMAACTNL